jgi:polysaccharide export outer membrane protein
MSLSSPSSLPPRGGRSTRRVRALGALLLLAPLGCRETTPTQDPAPRSPDNERAAALVASVNPANAPQPTSREMPSGPYRLGARDQVEIVVLDHPEWRQEMPVRPDGKISFLFVGDVVAAGRTVEELREDLQKGLERYLKKPQVSVAVRDFRSRFPHVYVGGQVRAPGAFELTPPHDTFLDAVFAAGGVTPQADLDLGYVIRGGEVVAADFDKLLLEGDRGPNFVMRDGDFAYFPRKDFLFVYVLGQVRNPTAVPAERPIKLVEAVALAGGLAPAAFKRDLRILRGGLRAGTSISVDFEEVQAGDREHDIYVYPGDIVFAPRTVLTRWNELLSELLPSLTAILLAEVLRTQGTR